MSNEFPASSAALECRDSHKGKHTDIHGEFEVYWSDESEPGLYGRTDPQRGWFYREAGSDPEGPFKSSREAFEAASAYGPTDD